MLKKIAIVVSLLLMFVSCLLCVYQSGFSAGRRDGLLKCFEMVERVILESEQENTGNDIRHHFGRRESWNL